MRMITVFLYLYAITSEYVNCENCSYICVGSNLVCGENGVHVCQCGIGYFNSSDATCRPGYKSPCVADAECRARNLDYSLCTQGQCLCNPGFFYPNETLRTNCYEAFGSTCRTSQECAVLLANSKCSLGACTCSYGYYYANSSLGCKPVFGSSCVGDQGCTERGGLGYTCLSTCSCSQGYYLSQGICLPVKGLSCNTHNDCLTKSPDYVCDMISSHQCYDPCLEVMCDKGGTCRLNSDMTIGGFICHCTDQYAGVMCGYNKDSLVSTTLIVPVTTDVLTYKFWQMCAVGIMSALEYGLCRENISCALNVKRQVVVELVSAKRFSNSSIVMIMYVASEGQHGRLADDVASVLNSLSPSEISQRLGYRAHTPAIGVLKAERRDYCWIKWGFKSPPQLSSLTEAILTDLAHRLSSLFYRAYIHQAAHNISKESISTTILNATISFGILELTFSFSKAGICLPAMSVIRLIYNLTDIEIFTEIGVSHASPPEAGCFSIDPSIYYQNAFVIRTLMDISKTEPYFSENWWRLQAGIGRVVAGAMVSYIERLEFSFLSKVTRTRKRQAINFHVDSTAILLDIQRVGSTEVVEIISCALINDVIVPVQYLLEYLSTYPAEQMAIHLSELIAPVPHIRAYDSSFLQHSAMRSDPVSNICLLAMDEATSMLYWIRTVLLVRPDVNVNDQTFIMSKENLLKLFFISAMSRRYKQLQRNAMESQSASKICVKMIQANRLSFDSEKTELIYLIIENGRPLLPDVVIELAALLNIQEVALMLGDVVDENRIVEAYGQPLNKKSSISTSGKQFLVAYMENDVEADWPESSSTLTLLLSTCGNSFANVRIDSPKSSSIFEPKDILVHPTGENAITIDHSMMVRGTGISRQALVITSDEPINVVAISRNYLAVDSTLVLPTSQLGTEYVAASVWPDGTKAQLAVTCMTDTLVVIELPKKADGELYEVNIEGIQYRGRITLTLRSYEVLQVQIAGDLSGSFIRSDQPIAVFSGNIAASIGGLTRDHLYEMMLPSLTAGTGFVAVTLLPDLIHQPDLLKVIALAPETLASVPSQDLTFRLANRGDHTVINMLLSDYSLYLYSNKEIKVYQITKSAKETIGDPSLLEVLPISRMSNYHIVMLPNYRNFLHYVMLYIGKQDIGGLLLDGKALPVSSHDWRTVPYTYPPFYSIVLTLSSGTYRLWHEKQDVIFSVYAYGRSVKASYFHSSGSCDSLSLAQFFATTEKTPVETDLTSRRVIQTTVKFVPWPIHTSQKATTPFWIDRDRESIKESASANSVSPTYSLNSRTTSTIKSFVSNLIIDASEGLKTNTLSQTSAPSQLNIDGGVISQDYWVFIVVNDTKNYDSMQLEANLLNSYLNAQLLMQSLFRRSLNYHLLRVKHHTQKDDTILQIVRVEPFAGNLAIVFFIMKNNLPVNTSHVIRVFSLISTAELSSLTELAVLENVAAYSNRRLSVHPADGASPSDKPIKANKSWTIFLALGVGSLLLLVIGILIKHHVMKNRKGKEHKEPSEASKDKKQVRVANKTPTYADDVTKTPDKSGGAGAAPAVLQSNEPVAEDHSDYPISLDSKTIDQVLSPYFMNEDKAHGPFRNKADQKKQGQRSSTNASNNRQNDSTTSRLEGDVINVSSGITALPISSNHEHHTNENSNKLQVPIIRLVQPSHSGDNYFERDSLKRAPASDTGYLRTSRPEKKFKQYKSGEAASARRKSVIDNLESRKSEENNLIQTSSRKRSLSTKSFDALRKKHRSLNRSRENKFLLASHLL